MIPANEAEKIANHVAEDIKAKKIEQVGKWMKDKEIEQKIVRAANSGEYGITIYLDDCPDVETLKKTMTALGYKVIVAYGHTMNINWGIWSDSATNNITTTIKKEGSTYDYLG